MDKFNQQLIVVLLKCRNVSIRKRESKAAALTVGTSTTINKAQLIHNFMMGNHWFSKYWVNWNRFWRSETKRNQRRNYRTSTAYLTAPEIPNESALLSCHNGYWGRPIFCTVLNRVMRFEKLSLKITSVMAGHPELMSVIVGVGISMGIALALTYIGLGQTAEARIFKPRPGCWSC